MFDFFKSDNKDHLHLQTNQESKDVELNSHRELHSETNEHDILTKK